jgi:hypothetical protein
MTFSQTNLYKINLIAVLEDIQDQLLCELQPEFQQGMKQMTNQARLHTRKLIREFDRIHSSENAEKFGIAADQIRELLDKHLLTENS